LLAAAIFPLALFAQKGAYTLTGEANDLPEGHKIFLIYDGKQDSTSVNDGVFVFEGALDEPVKAYLVASASLREVGRNPRATFYLEPGTITVTVDGADMGTATFQGGPVNELYSSYEQLLEPVTQQSAALSAMYREAGNEERQTDAFQERYRKQNEA